MMYLNQRKVDMKKLVLLDLDSTLIDDEYHLNVPLEHLKKSLKEAESRSLTIGISSDSSAETISAYEKLCGLSGPIVAEKGAYLTRGPDIGNGVLTIKQTSIFPVVRKKFVKKLLIDPRVLVIHGDVNEISRLFPNLPCNNCSSSKAVLVNNSRILRLDRYAYYPRVFWIHHAKFASLRRKPYLILPDRFAKGLLFFYKHRSSNWLCGNC